MNSFLCGFGENISDFSLGWIGIVKKFCLRKCDDLVAKLERKM